MEVHATQNLDLPPLKINRRSERQNIEESAHVETLIKTRLLLDPAFNALLITLVANTKQLLDFGGAREQGEIEMLEEIRDA